MEQKKDNFEMLGDGLVNAFIDTKKLSKDRMKLVLHKTNLTEIEYPNFEYQYCQSLKRLLEFGTRVSNRTGIDTLRIDHQYFVLKDIEHNFPRLKGKKVFPKLALKELLWMLYGRVDIKWLNEHGVTYWDEWQDSCGTIGKSYGYQFRNFNGTDQIYNLVNDMLYNPFSRRHIVNLWNSSELNEMVLPPCMYDYHFTIEPKEDKFIVNLHAHVRSNDSFLGAPYDFMFCAWFMKLICKYLNNSLNENKYICGDIHYTADDYHLYVNHIEQAKQYIKNVEENKDFIIDSCCRMKFPSMSLKSLNFDNYLDWIEINLSKIKISKNMIGDRIIDFEYGKIEADIAV